jgi:phage terminase large subunit-like protein
MDRATAYADDVLAGRIVAGPYVRAACQRHRRDLETGARRGLTWDIEAGRRAIGFFENVLRLAGGEHEGKPFHLEPWQCFTVGSLFAWRRVDGTRRFRVAFVEAGKGCGKSPLAAGIGTYLMMSDREPRAEIYAAASKKDQAMVLFRDAVAMVKQSPALKKRLVFSGGAGREWNIAYLQADSFFRPISSDDKQSGPRPHCALLDEIHEHPDNTMVEMLRAGFKGRRQPLQFMITNSGVDRTSVCYQYHDYACKVAAGELQDDSFFSYVCALDQARTETYNTDVSLERMSSECQCSARSIQIAPLKLGDFAQAVIKSFENSGILSGGKSVPSIQTARCFREVFAQIATKHGLPPLTPNIVKRALQLGSDTLNETGKKFAPSMLLGDSDKSRRILIGSESDLENTSSILPPPSSPSFGNDRAADVEYADERRPIYGLITIILRALCADSSVIPVIRDSVCSAIISRLYEQHSTTCPIRQLYRIDNGTLARDYPDDDPFTDPSCWVKANPSLGVTIQPAYLEEQLREARGMPAKESIVRRLNFCTWVDAANPWVAGELWRACETDFDLSERDGEPCWGGLDLSGARDLTSLALVWPREDGFLDAAVWYWTPGDTVFDRARRERVPYDVWARDGYLEAPPGKAIDYGFVARTLGDLAARFDLHGVAFDPYRIRYFEQDMADAGVHVSLLSHAQGYYKAQQSGLWMPHSVDLLEKAVLEGRLRVKHNPVLTWNSASAVLVADAKANRIFDKRKSTGRIDGIVALAMAIGAAGEEATEELSVYEILARQEQPAQPFAASEEAAVGRGEIRV